MMNRKIMEIYLLLPTYVGLRSDFPNVLYDWKQYEIVLQTKLFRRFLKNVQ